MRALSLVCVYACVWLYNVQVAIIEIMKSCASRAQYWHHRSNTIDLLSECTCVCVCVCACMMHACMCACVFVGSYLATKDFIGNLLAMGRGWAIIK